MKRRFLMITTIVLASLLAAGSVAAQMKGDGMKMADMKNDPHHKLMMAYMMSMSGFASALRDEAARPQGMDVEFARSAVTELRHNLDAMEALHEKHMAGMTSEMQAKMKTMMDKMDKDQAMVKEHLAALETAVKADKPDAKQVALHAYDLVKHFAMMKMEGKKKMKM